MTANLKTWALGGLLAIGVLGGAAPAARADWQYNPATGAVVWVPPAAGYGQYLQNELLERQLTGGQDIPDPGDALYRPYPVYDPAGYNQYLQNELLERQLTGGQDLPDVGDVIYRP